MKTIYDISILFLAYIGKFLQIALENSYNLY